MENGWKDFSDKIQVSSDNEEQVGRELVNYANFLLAGLDAKYNDDMDPKLKAEIDAYCFTEKDYEDVQTGSDGCYVNYAPNSGGSPDFSQITYATPGVSTPLVIIVLTMFVIMMCTFASQMY